MLATVAADVRRYVFAVQRCELGARRVAEERMHLGGRHAPDLDAGEDALLLEHFAQLRCTVVHRTCGTVDEVREAERGDSTFAVILDTRGTGIRLQKIVRRRTGAGQDDKE
jgi:hypothetical protein